MGLRDVDDAEVNNNERDAMLPSVPIVSPKCGGNPISRGIRGLDSKRQRETFGDDDRKNFSRDKETTFWATQIPAGGVSGRRAEHQEIHQREAASKCA